MFVVVHHKISDPEKFWAQPEEFLSKIPGDLKLHTSLPIVDGTRATCLWECGSLPKLREFMEKYTAGIATNEYIQVDENRALGLPKKTVQEAQVGERARA